MRYFQQTNKKTKTKQKNLQKKIISRGLKIAGNALFQSTIYFYKNLLSSGRI